MINVKNKNMNIKEFFKNKKILISILVLIIFSIIYIILNFSNIKMSTETKNINVDPKLLIKGRTYFPSEIIDNEFYFLGDKGQILYNYNLSSQQSSEPFTEEILSPEKLIYNDNLSNLVVFSNYPFENVQTYDLSNLDSNYLNGSIDQIDYYNTDKIVYIFSEQPDLYTLNISDLDGNNWQKIADLPASENGYLLHVSDKIIFYSDYNAIYKIDFDQSKSVKIIDKTIIEDFMVSEDSSKIIYNPSDSENTLVYDRLTGKEFVLPDKIDINNSLILDNRIFYSNSVDEIIIYSLDNSNKQILNINTSLLDNNNLQQDYIKILSVDSLTIYFSYNDYTYYIQLEN